MAFTANGNHLVLSCLLSVDFTLKSEDLNLLRRFFRIFHNVGVKN